jgi:hypothetical protein
MRGAHGARLGGGGWASRSGHPPPGPRRWTISYRNGSGGTAHKPEPAESTVAGLGTSVLCHGRDFHGAAMAQAVLRHDEGCA